MTSDPAPGSNGASLPPSSPYGPPPYRPPAYGPPSYGQPGNIPNPYGQPGYAQPGMLAAAADRERTMDVLKAAFGEGRLTKEELDARAARAMSARTYSDLNALVADLPLGPGGPAPVQPYQYFHPAPQPPTNGLAIGSLACGILGFTIPAVILGHIARGQIRRTGERGDGLAITGLVLGYLGIALWMIIIIAMVASGG